jgi:hypothetical protein
MKRSRFWIVAGSAKMQASVLSFLLVKPSEFHAKIWSSRFVEPSQLLAFLQV